jgi:hypothetical protein
MTNPYLDLTAAFNAGRLRALVSSGQAVVMHRLAIMSKDGDWVLREDPEALGHVLEVLAGRGARMSLREKDYAVIGELARRMTDEASALRYSRSARDLIRLAAEHPDVLARVRSERPLLEYVARGRDALEAELDRERRALMHADEARMARDRAAAAGWAAMWPRLSPEIAGLPLLEAHRVVVARAEGVLPFTLPEDACDA